MSPHCSVHYCTTYITSWSPSPHHHHIVSILTVIACWPGEVVSSRGMSETRVQEELLLCWWFVPAQSNTVVTDSRRQDRYPQWLYTTVQSSQFASTQSVHSTLYTACSTVVMMQVHSTQYSGHSTENRSWFLPLVESRTRSNYGWNILNNTVTLSVHISHIVLSII